MDLWRQSSESLAGRIAYLEMGPLDARDSSHGRHYSLGPRRIS